MFGKPAFGASAPSTSFVQSTGSPGLFGQPATTGGGLFSNTPTFGQQNKPTTFGFGAPTQNSSFLGGQQPQTTSIFNTSAGGGLFGASTAFGAAQSTGTQVKFVPVTGNDTMMKNGTAQGISTKHHSITCMKEYENKSFEELRFEDYQANRKGPQQGSTGFGGSAFGTTAQSNPLFINDVNKATGFGQNISFAQTSTFGQPTQQQSGFNTSGFGTAPSTTNSLFGQTDANKQSTFGQIGFGQTSTFGQNNSGFGMTNQPNQSSPFGKTTFGTTNTSTGFNFGNAAPQNTGLFGANKNTFGTVSTPSQGLFGTATSQPNTGFGGGLFSNNQNTTTGLFNKPAQPTTGFGATGQTPSFSFNTPASTQPSLFSNTVQQKPLFGTATGTTPAFGTGTGFGATNTGFGAGFGKPTTTAFGQTQPTGLGTFNSGFNTQNTFGTTNTGFGTGFGKPATAPNFASTFNTGLGGTTTTGLFGQQNQNKPLFSNTGGSLFSNTNTAFPSNTFGLGQPAQQQPLAQPDVSNSNLAQLTSDPFGDAPHLAGLEPKVKRPPVATATDPKELKAIIDTKNLIEFHHKKLTLYPKNSARDSLFEVPSKPDQFTSPPKEFYQQASVRKLVLKPRPESILDSESLLDRLLNRTKTKSNELPGKPNPVKLTFDASTEVLDSTRSVESQTFVELKDPETNATTTQEETVVAETEKPHPAKIICTRPEYYTLPPLNVLMPDEDGKCVVKGFAIGRKGYGNVYFGDEMDVANLNIDELLHFRYREINVYPDESKKPPVGQGLNRRAQVTLDKVYPRRTGTNELVTDFDDLIQMNFSEKLRKVTEKKNARFVDYRPETGSWVFKVDHFSKYGYNDSDDEDEAEMQKKPAPPKKQQQQQKVPSPQPAATKEELVRTDKQPTKSTTENIFSLDKDILIDDEEDEENDLFHHSMLMDDDSDDDDNEIDIFRPPPSGSLKEKQNIEKIQLMKAAFFGDDQSDGAESHVSIMRQYLDIQDMDKIEETVPEQASVVVRKRAMIRPKVWKLLNPFQALKATSKLLSSRCIQDMGLFKGKSLKVGWYKGFTYYCVDGQESQSLGELLVNTFDATPEFDPIQDILTDSLKVVLEESTHELSGNKVPTFRILKSNSYLKKQSAIFKKLSTQYTSSQANYLNSIWTLFNALWGPNENTFTHRRHLLSEWLKSTCTNEEELVLKTQHFKSVTEATQSIFAHLSVFKVLEAANIAMDNKLPNLSLLIAQLSLSNTPKGFIQEQIDGWYRSMTATHISKELKRIYLLLAGIPFKDDINIFEGVDWKRAFAIHLWYVIGTGNPIEFAIDQYQKAFNEFEYATKPLPPYTDEGNSFDILYHILLLYKSRIHRLSHVLSPATHTSDPLDYRLSWLLLQLFLSLDIGLVDNCEIDKFCTSFSNQLEQLGLWQWAIFVLLYIDNDLTKSNLIVRILDRNIHSDVEDDVINLLVNQMMIPYEWIHSVRAHKCFADELYFEAMNHYILAEDFVTANDIFVHHLLPSFFITEQYDIIRSMSNKLKAGRQEILNWNTETGLIVDYLDLVEQYITDDVLVKLQMELFALAERIVHFPRKTLEQEVFVAELSKRCANLYRELSEQADSDTFRLAHPKFVETLIMPADYKRQEALYMIQDFYKIGT